MRALAIVVALSVTSTARADSGDSFDGGTMGLQLLGGVGAGAVGGAAGGFAFYGLTRLATGKDNWGNYIMGAFGVLAGGVAGMVVGVKVVGDARDGTGGYGGTWLGFLGGAATTGIAGAVVSGAKLDLHPVIKVGGGIALVTAGSIVGYQLSNDGPATATERRFVVALPVLAF